MGVSFDINYVFGFTWTFPGDVDEKVVKDIMDFLYNFLCLKNIKNDRANIFFRTKNIFCRTTEYIFL